MTLILLLFLVPITNNYTDENPELEAEQNFQFAGANLMVEKITTGGSHTCAIPNNGSVSCWGNNANGQLGDGTYTNRNTPTVTNSLGINRTAIEISAGHSHTCVILDNGLVSCWGDNSYGQLGDGTNSTKNTPTLTSSLGLGRAAVSITAGKFHTCAVLDNGSISCWGYNAAGQLGDGTYTDRYTPISIYSTTVDNQRARVIEAGDFHTCAIYGDELGNVESGTNWNTWMKCWGLNTDGQLGINSAVVNAYYPTEVQGSYFESAVLYGPVSISAGGSHTCAASVGNGGSNFAVWCWGKNNFGQLGIGNQVDHDSPQNVDWTSWSYSPNDIGTFSISLGSSHSCYVFTSYTKCWGDNEYGKLGVGDGTIRTSPSVVHFTADRIAITISSGGDHTCAILDDGSVSCWGLNNHGQLGDGTYENRLSPVSTKTLSSVRTAIEISAGDSHTCAILDDGSVSCWGENFYGQLGDDTTTSRTLPTRVNGLAEAYWYTGGAEKISAGDAHTCAILEDGSVSCWGLNSDGQLGIGSSQGYRITPHQAGYLGVGRTAVEISAGEGHTCAILDDGSVSCWGRNGNGQLGDGTYANRNTPTKTTSLGLDRTAIAISAGDAHTCAILDNGLVSCWGDNSYGQLGDGTNSTKNTPTLTSSLGLGRAAVSITAGKFHTCAVLDNGSISCWGYNAAGQLGDGTYTDRYTPISIYSTTVDNQRARVIEAGDFHTCAIYGDELGNVESGTNWNTWMKCWGLNTDGQLGINSAVVNAYYPTEVQGSYFESAVLYGPVSISAGGSHTCAASVGNGGSNFAVWCWGKNNFGQLGIGNQVDHDSPQNVDWTSWSYSPNDIGTFSISLGSSHSCYVFTSYTKCWGDNEYGKLGVGDGTIRTSPSVVHFTADRIAITISSGGDHTCAILDDGSVSCWGLNNHGQLGDGTYENRLSPVSTKTLSSVRTAIEISAGDSHTCAILDDGSVSCWGENFYGQLGDDTTTSRTLPTRVNGLAEAYWYTGGAEKISAGDAHTCAILEDGSVSCWGLNSDGQLGDGTYANRNTPMSDSFPIDGINKNAIEITTGGYHSCVTLETGDVNCWGRNSEYQVYEGSDDPSSPVSSSFNFEDPIKITAGYQHTCSISHDGDINCWGWNAQGQIGAGIEQYSFMPAASPNIGLGRSAVEIAAGYAHTCAILDDGSVSCWGSNDHGRLGDGTIAQRNQPTQTALLGMAYFGELTIDEDSDGISDYNDECLNTIFGSTVDGNGCANYQLDLDGDGVSDGNDNCANTNIEWNVDIYGCAEYQKDSDADGVNDYDDLCPNTNVDWSVDRNGCGNHQKDSDGDGSSDAVDLCPGTPSGILVDYQGCTAFDKDSDNDGRSDGIDVCPDTELGSSVDSVGCANYQLDIDQDSIPNEFDLCPNTSPQETVDNDGCSSGQLDDDNDGVTNSLDLCLFTPIGTPGSSIDENGCKIFPVMGCIDEYADNYDLEATENDDSCLYIGKGLMTHLESFSGIANFDASDTLRVCVNRDTLDETLLSNYFNSQGISFTIVETIQTFDNGLNLFLTKNCEAIMGDFDDLIILRTNFDDESFNQTGIFSIPLVGCMSPNANNYHTGATVNLEGLCDYDLDDDGILDVDELFGCTDPIANNFNPLATENTACDYNTMISPVAESIWDKSYFNILLIIFLFVILQFQLIRFSANSRKINVNTPLQNQNLWKKMDIYMEQYSQNRYSHEQISDELKLIADQSGRSLSETIEDWIDDGIINKSNIKTEPVLTKNLNNDFKKLSNISISNVKTYDEWMKIALNGQRMQEGAIGDVWRIKTDQGPLFIKTGKNQKGKNVLLKEINTLEELMNENLGDMHPKILFQSKNNDNPLLVMTQVGETSFEEEYDKLERKDIIYFLYSLAKDIQKLHTEGHYVHRDLKPGNIAINNTKSGNSIYSGLIDFGSARRNMRKQGEGDRFISPPWTHPSQREIGIHVQPGQDWYSFTWIAMCVVIGTKYDNVEAMIQGGTIQDKFRSKFSMLNSDLMVDERLKFNRLLFDLVDLVTKFGEEPELIELERIAKKMLES